MYDVFEAQMDLSDERHARRASTSKLEVIPYAYRGGGDESTAAIAPLGSMVIYIAAQGSADLSALREAARKSAPMPKNILKKLQSEYSRRKPVSLEQSVDAIKSADLFLDVNCGEEPIVKNFALVPGLSLLAIPLIYSGGKLDSEAFETVKYLKKGTMAKIDAVAVVSKPPLTAAEAAALRKIPAGMRHLHVSAGVPDVSWCPAVTLVVYAITVATICFSRRVSDIKLPPRVLQQLPPTAALRALIALRLKALHGRV
jgi:hypothetical protein